MPETTEETLVLVKPDGVARNLTGEILRRIEAKGYALVDIRLVEADRALLAQHYAEHQGKPFYEPLVEFMESGPIVAIRLAGNHDGRAGHHPRRPRPRLGARGAAEPGARQRLGGVGRARAAPLVRLTPSG